MATYITTLEESNIFFLGATRYSFYEVDFDINVKLEANKYQIKVSNNWRNGINIGDVVEISEK